MRWQGLEDTTGFLDVRFDSIDKIVKINNGGFWTPNQVDEVFEVLSGIRENRLLGVAKLRVLVDHRKTSVQSTDTVERLRYLAGTFYRPGDRVAVLVDTVLAKMQLRRILNEETHALFISESDAHLWLNA